MGSKKIKYSLGEIVGACLYVCDAAPHTQPNGQKCRMAIFMCSCGKEFVARISDVKNGHAKSCGCLIKSGVPWVTHGFTNHTIYNRWADIIQRCENKNKPEYKTYGGRGIKICAEWRNDFETFLNYVMHLPNALGKGLTLDRIKNDGNYEIGNLRWVNMHVQNANKGKQKSNTSGYVGVGYYKTHGKWASKISVNNKSVFLGLYDTANEAAEVRNKYILDNNLTEYPIQKIKS